MSMDVKPFHEVIGMVCGKRVVQVDRLVPRDQRLIGRLDRVARLAASEVNRTPIVRRRPNEVGNDVEGYVKRALQTDPGFRTVGMGRGTGYPDIMVRVDEERWLYVECKTYSQEQLNTAFRSFYLSPSRSFKVTQDAVHVAMSFCMVEKSAEEGRREYTPVAFKILDLYSVPCRLKSEWNSSNRELYAEERILAESCI